MNAGEEKIFDTADRAFFELDQVDTCGFKFSFTESDKVGGDENDGDDMEVVGTAIIPCKDTGDNVASADLKISDGLSAWVVKYHMWEYQVDVSGDQEIPYDEDDWGHDGNYIDDDYYDDHDYYFDEDRYDGMINEGESCDETTLEIINEVVQE